MSKLERQPLVGKYKPYPEYKDSGVEWLGKIPSHWAIKKIAWYFKAQKGRNAQMLTKEFCGENPGDFPVYSGQTENDGVMGSINSYEFDSAQDGCLFATTVGAKAMTLSFLKGKFSLSQNCMVITPTSDVIDTRFYFYHCQPLFSYERGLIPEHMQASFRMEDLYQYQIAMPNLQEQQTIATFLDYETARIDWLITQQQRLIELLKEKRQAVISHAVTKGLNPDAPMKDSGIEWLGQVPEHWGVKRLKHISPKIGVGLVINPSHYVQENGVYFLFGGDIEEYGFKLENTRKMSDENSRKLPQSRLFENDLVCVRVGYPGITAVVTNDLDGSNCASMMVIRRGDFNSNWLAYCLNSDLGKKQVEVVQYGAAQKQYNIADAVEFRFPVPPIVEQFEISKYLKEQRDKFNALISKSHSTVQLLQERRTALISAAVTGKIDLRGWTPPAEEVAA